MKEVRKEGWQAAAGVNARGTEGRKEDLSEIICRFQAAGVDQILRAFKTLDAVGKGELTVDEVK